MTMPADLPGAASLTDVSPPLDVPRLYLASPLTGLGDEVGSMSERVTRVQQCIEEFTDTDRLPADRWKVRAYAPIDFTPPWVNDRRSPAEIYEINLEALLNSDGLIVITNRSSSAGVGQEIEWARCIGMPILHLTPHEASRQIRGIPHNITFGECADIDQTREHVRNWLTANRRVIEDGPRRRANRQLAYLALTTDLAHAWHTTFDKTSAAHRAGLLPAAVDSLLQSPARVAIAPLATVQALANEFGVKLGPRVGLTFAESVAWTTAASAGQWDAATAEKVRSHALLHASRGLDLEAAAAWTLLGAQLATSST